MNRRALLFGCIYCLLFIIYKLVILIGGYTLTKFGFYYSNIVGMVFIIPFYFITVQQVRDKDFGGVISGRDAMRMCMTVLATAVIITSIYNYFEFNLKYKDIATEYYHSDEYLNVLRAQQSRYPDKIKTENFPAIIEEQISALSAFKATTGKLIPLMFVGLGGAFLASIMLKRSARP